LQVIVKYCTMNCNSFDVLFLTDRINIINTGYNY
jgi:hypothetical protein